VLWTQTVGDAREIRARRFLRDGTPSGEAFVVAAHACRYPFSVASRGDHTIVAYIRGCDVTPPTPALYAADIGSAGSASVVTLLEAATTSQRPVAASNGSDVFVVWEESVRRESDDPCPRGYEDNCPPKHLLRGATIESGAVRKFPIAGDPPYLNLEPHIASNGRDYLVTWLAADDLDSSPRVQARLFSSSGEALSQLITPTQTTPRDAGSGDKLGVAGTGSVVWNGHNFIIAWLTLSSTAAGRQLGVWFLDADATSTPQEMPVDDGNARPESPQLAMGPSSAVFVLYSVPGPSASFFGSNRVVFQSLVPLESRRRAVGRGR
jgi:hypothetical protein